MARQAKVNREDILQAAFVLIDEGGLEALTMRRLGTSLGVEAMTLYNWVGNKEALLSSLYELILSRVELPERSSNWRRDLATAAKSLRRALIAHPRALGLFLCRPVVTDASLRYVEWILSVLREPIPQDLDRAYALQSLLGYVVGHTALQFSNYAGLRPDYERLGPSEFPEMAAVSVLLKNHSLEVEFELGLGALLEAIERRNPF